MTRLWPEGVPLEVETDGQQPLAFHWQDRRHRVSFVADHWVIHDEWWRSAQAVATLPGHVGEIWRSYFQVETADDLLCVLYHDLLSDQWYLERVYD